MPDLKSAAPLYGLVLAGGQGRRLGMDKSLIFYDGSIPQHEFAARCLRQVCEDVYISLRKEQPLATTFPVIRDLEPGLGPFGAILTALTAYPERAWFVLAVDLPLFDVDAATAMISRRRPEKIATAYRVDGYPQPLAAIWEPSSLKLLEEHHMAGQYSPTDLLRQADIEIVNPENPDWLLNVNLPADLEKVRNLLRNRK